MNCYKGANIERVRQLSNRLGVTALLGELLDHFVAGTMFYARLDASRPLVDLNLSEEDFELEAGQIDGNLERLVSYAALAAGFLIGELREIGRCPKGH